MEFRRLGKSGLKVSELCLGTMQFGWTADEETSLEILTAAFEAGIQFIDTADIYSTWVEGNSGGVAETIVGKWLRSGVVERDEVVIATKVRGRMGPGPNSEGLSRVHIMASVEASLRRLGTDYIDLYQLHWPDTDTPIEETLDALDSLVRRGEVRYLGCSNYPAWKIMQALWASDHHGWAAFVSLQPHYNLLHRGEFEREEQAVAEAYGLGVMPYSPLAGGFLTGKYRQEQKPPKNSRGATSSRIQGYMGRDQSWKLLDLLEQLGRERGKSISQIALGWLNSRPAVTSPIIGPRSLEQLEDNLGAVGLRLSGEEQEAIEAVSVWREE